MITFHAVASGRNCGNFLSATINSILTQRLNGHRLIIHAIDDASTDNTWSQLVKYTASQDPDPVRLYQNAKHMGAAYSRMQAIRSADVKPDDVIFLIGLDGDLLAYDGVLERIWTEYEKGADMTYGSWTFVQGGKWEQQPYDKKTLKDKTFRQAPWRCAPLQTFRARLVQDLPDELFKVDGEWLLACSELALLFPALERAEKIVYIPETMVLYNYHGGSTRRVYGNKKLAWAEAIRKQEWQTTT